MTRKKVTYYVPSKHHHFNHLPFPQLFTEGLYFGHVVRNICRLWQKKNQSNSAIVFQPEQTSKQPYFEMRKKNGIHDLVDSAASVAWNLVMHQVHPCFDDVCKPFRDHWYGYQHSWDQRRPTSMGRKHPNTIDAAKKDVISWSDTSFHRRFSMACQIRTLHFHLM